MANDEVPTTSNSFPTHRSCKFCDTPALDKPTFISHVTGKKHARKTKANKNKEPHGCTLFCSYGYSIDQQAPFIGYFWDRGLIGGLFLRNICFLQFITKEAAKNVMNEKHKVSGRVLKLEYKEKSGHYKNNNNSKDENLNDAPQISRTLSNRMLRLMNSNEIDDCILLLLQEIELTPQEQRDRENVRFEIQCRFQSLFPGAQAFMFGSSENSLGFRRCDLDLFMNFGNRDWLDGNGKYGQMKQRAAQFTYYISRLIRSLNLGYNVTPVPRARVPIIRFQDVHCNVKVDLSFKNELPLYNTRLIQLYTRMHPIVRPYMMFLRYWATVQNITGGGQPSTLLTNYSFTMLMLFWLMFRKVPIVPPVSWLREKLMTGRLYRPAMIDGWDCNFSTDVGNWPDLYHRTSILELVSEFLQFYGELDTKQWVICPLIGHLITRKDMLGQNPSVLPPLLSEYCRGRPIENSDFCVQDPFEHCHNITKGLRGFCLDRFQRKCLRASQIASNVLEKATPLSHILEIISLDDADSEAAPNSTVPQIDLVDDITSDSIEVIEQIFEEQSSPVSVLLQEEKNSNAEDSATLKNNKDEEITHIPDDNPSHDAPEPDENRNEVESISDDIQVLSSISNQDTGVPLVDIDDEMQSNSPDIEILPPDAESQKDVIQVSVINSELDNDPAERNESPTIVLQTETPLAHAFPIGSCDHHFLLDFSNIPGFNLDGKGTITTAEPDGSSYIDYICFLLKKCLKIDVSRDPDVDICESSPNKRLKLSNGEALSTSSTDPSHLATLECASALQLWSERKQLSKTLFKGSYENPLLYEEAVTELMISKGIPNKYGSLQLNFLVDLWISDEQSRRVCVGGTLLSDSNKQKQFKQFFVYFDSFAHSLLHRLSVHLYEM